MIVLKMTEDQAKICAMACEFYARIRMGQFNEILWNCFILQSMDDDHFLERRDEAERLLLEARKQIYPDLYGVGHSYGVGKFVDADTAFDIHQSIRYAMGDGRKPFSYRQLPVCENLGDAK